MKKNLKKKVSGKGVIQSNPDAWVRIYPFFGSWAGSSSSSSSTSPYQSRYTKMDFYTFWQKKQSIINFLKFIFLRIDRPIFFNRYSKTKNTKKINIIWNLTGQRHGSAQIFLAIQGFNNNCHYKKVFKKVRKVKKKIEKVEKIFAGICAFLMVQERG